MKPSVRLVVAMQTFLEVAKNSARRAGQHIQLACKQVSQLEIEQKGRYDYVSRVDRESEQIIQQCIHAEFPDHGFLGEEFGRQSLKKSAFQWVVDPLDGTTNFLRSIPHYAISIALLHDNAIQLGVVYDPVKDELFHATKNGGAFLNGKALAVSCLPSIQGGLFATGIPFGGEPFAHLPAFTKTMQGLLSEQTSGIRRLGSAALDLAYVAAGRYDGYWEASLKLWDIAAGILLVTEAGGVVSDLSGDQAQMQSGDVLAANAKVHHDMLAISSQYY